MRSVMGAFAEFERSLIRERQREGIELAKARGVYRGRTRSLSEDQVADLRRRIGDGVAKAVIARELGVSRETRYQALRTGSGTPVGGAGRRAASQNRSVRQRTSPPSRSYSTCSRSR